MCTGTATVKQSVAARERLLSVSGVIMNSIFKRKGDIKREHYIAGLLTQLFELSVIEIRGKNTGKWNRTYV